MYAQMKKPVVDYRTLRFSNLGSPQFRHLHLLWSWVGYLALFVLTERLIPGENCYPVHCLLDDVIPFCEWFVIPYVAWYFLIAVSLIYFLLYNVENFKGLQTYIIVTQVVAILCYILFPTRQDLRPTVFPRDNLLTDMVRTIYALDTNTGVCPSLHVAFSIGIASAWLKEKGASPWGKAFAVTVAVLVCLSVAFIKQHSVIDFFAAIPVCALAEWIAYGKYYWKKLQKPPR